MRFSRELAGFLNISWPDWRDQDQAAYAMILADGGLVPRDGTLIQLSDPD